MFAAILNGMNAQREKNTTNRREAAKLFNEHLKNQSDLGIAVTEESLSDAWNSNSGGVMQRHAPTQQRLQGIVTAQNKSLAEKQLVSEINQLEQSQKIRAMNESSLQGFFKTQARKIPTAKDISTLRESLGTNQLLLDDFDTYTGSGTNIAAMQSAYDRDQQAPEMEKVMQLIATMKTPDAAALKKVYTNVDPAFIDNAVDQAQKGIDQSDKLEGREDIKFEQAQEDRVTNLAREIVEQAQADSNFKLNTAQLEAALLKARVAVKRLVIDNKQGDATFAQNFEANVVAAATLAKQTINAEIDRIRNMSAEDLAAEQLATTNTQGNAESVYNFGQVKKKDTQINLEDERTNANYAANQLQLVNQVLDRQVQVNAATEQSVIAALAGRGITDQDTIDNTWNLVNATQSQQIMTEMTQTKASNTVALAKEEAQISALIKKDVETNQDKVSNHMKAISAPDQVVSAANVIAARYFISGEEIGYFQDYVKGKIDDKSWQNASQVEILDSMAEFASQRNPMFASKQAELVAQAKLRIGPDPYTPLGYKGYVDETTDEFNVHLKSMETAIENKNLTDFKVAKGALTSLLIDMQADTKARESNPQKVFGKTVTPEEVASSLKLMEDLVADMATQGDMEPPEKAAVVTPEPRQFRAGLYVPPLNYTGRIGSIEDALSVINGTLQRQPNNTKFKLMKREIDQSVESFPALVEEYDLLKAQLDPLPEQDVEDQIRAEMKEKAEKIKSLQVKVETYIKLLG